MTSKMRMVFPYPGKRNPQNEDRVTFKKSKEFKLREKVREQGRLKVTPCLFEMSLVFSCLKESGFNEKLCNEEVENFNACYMKALQDAAKLKERRLNPSKLVSADKLIDVEINEMFSRFKQK